MKIYISSTFEDLQTCRTTVVEQLRRLRGITPIVMEDYTAGEKRPLSQCVEDVSNADLYVGIFAWRYGYIPTEDNPGSLSITELEYLAAGRRGIDRLIYLLRDDAPWSPVLMDVHTGKGDDGRQIKRLRTELGRDHTVAFFSTADQLAMQVSASVTNVMNRPVSEIGLPDVRTEETPTRASASPFSEKVFEPQSRRDRLRQPQWFKTGLEVASGVGRIEELSGRPFSTGFLVSGLSLHARLGSDLYVLTPAHVIVPEKTPGSYGRTVDELCFRLTMPPDAQETIRLAGLAWFSPVDELDMSIVRLERQPSRSRALTVAGSLPALHHASVERGASDASDTARRVGLFGHNYGRELSFVDGVLIDLDDTALQYVADTQPGSAGSPVLDEAWRAIGVHRLRGKIPSLSGADTVDACQAVTLLAVRRALAQDFG